MAKFVKILAGVMVTGLLVASCVLSWSAYQHKSLSLLGGSTGEKVSYEAIGTRAASSTLTAAYSGNTKTFRTGYLENLHLDFEYSTPSTTNRFMYILLEGSNDGVSFFPLSNKVNGTAETDVYVEDLDCGATCSSSNIGIPLIIPGDKTSTTSVYYKGTYDTDIVADFIRISAKETGTANFGKVYVRATFSSKN